MARKYFQNNLVFKHSYQNFYTHKINHKRVQGKPREEKPTSGFTAADRNTDSTTSFPSTMLLHIQAFPAPATSHL